MYCTQIQLQFRIASVLHTSTRPAAVKTSCDVPAGRVLLHLRIEHLHCITKRPRSRHPRAWGLPNRKEQKGCISLRERVERLYPLPDRLSIRKWAPTGGSILDNHLVGAKPRPV